LNNLDLFAQIDTNRSRKNKAMETYNKMFFIPKSDTVWKSLTIDMKWKFVSDSIGGCLTGGQYCVDSKCGGMGCCFNMNPYWNSFLTLPKKDLVDFLISKLSDTVKTKVHTCPYFNATKAELATYCLQRIFKINWYDIDKKYQKYVDGTLKPTEDFYSLQDVLQKLLIDKNELKKMKIYWTKLNI
jgi:hypothetical protein